MKKYISKKNTAIFLAVILILTTLYLGWFGPKQAIAFCSQSALMDLDYRYSTTLLIDTDLINVDLDRNTINQMYTEYQFSKDMCLSKVGLLAR